MNRVTQQQQYVNSHPRIFRNYRYAYPVISRRSGGISIGVNLSPGKLCNFNCIYCQVSRKIQGIASEVDANVLIKELSNLLENFDQENICRFPEFARLPDKEKKLRDIALSGDGEPTLAPNFRDICSMLSEFQRTAAKPFKLVLITNAARLALPDVLAGLDEIMKKSGEIWAKLDAGSTADYLIINRPGVSLKKVEAGLLTAGRKHPLHIQTLLFRLNGRTPSAGQIRRYCNTLNRLTRAGCMIAGIQLHSIARQPAEKNCLPLERAVLLRHADEIKAMTGLPVEVY